MISISIIRSICYSGTFDTRIRADRFGDRYASDYTDKKKDARFLFPDEVRQSKRAVLWNEFKSIFPLIDMC